MVDTLYAVPKQVMARLRAKQATAQPAEDDKRTNACTSRLVYIYMQG